MGAKVLDLDMVLNLDVLEMPVHHLHRQDRPKPIQETWLRIVFDMQSIMAVLNMTLKTLIDFNLTSFACLLLINGK